MKELNFNENWQLWKEKLKKEFPHLTDEDLKYEPGREEELWDRLQKKLYKNKEEITKWLHVMG